AWLWRQLHDELERRGATSMSELQVRIGDLSEQLQRLTATLVEKRSWASQVRRTNLEQRQALNGWKLSVKRAGKGTGKRAPRLLADARRLMPVCQTAVPVWIMPLSRVVENFDPRRNRFDVVIIDEASQSDVMALVALYLGKQVVVVGDNEQVSPSAVGQDLDEVQKLIDEHLPGIPSHVHYDGQLSIYDMAQMSFEPICLREHFRCVSPIIQFSNHLSYNGKITPLRDASEVKRRPHTVVYRTPDTDGSLRQRELESLTVTSLLVAMTEQPEYAEATFGVIGMVGDDQAMRIDTFLRRFMSTTAYTQHKVQCGNPANFQGDERDVILLSMVDHNEGTGPLSLKSMGANDMFKKRFNVAASRARDQMWIVHSLNPDVDLKAEDLRLRLIQHAENPYALVNLMQQEQVRTESEFERLVLQMLVSAGYKVKTQWSVGAYRIDMVVEGAGKHLAVECDGDRYHTMDDLPQDMARQAILERLGWRFVRIRGSQFFRNPEAAMKPVFERLQKLGIPPEGTAGGEAFSDEQALELRDRVIRRAAELRREWANTPFDLGVVAPARGRRTERKPVPTRVEDKPASAVVLPADSPAKPTVQKEAPPTPKVSKKPAGGRAEDSKSLVVQTTLFPQPVASESTVVRFLQQLGTEYVDKRPIGGALWIVGGTELQPLVEKFRTIGVEFSFAPAGGRATAHRSAWFTKSPR
ncbi:MAG TPA: AAA domain-containing protein, partial [Symbiobacteriaceae bacterium]|nr:AAA domain-containing protein [Symbiobacteriaceae bacterium]